ncbi:hypothetical protein EPUS_01055 [Endocarpon pusillum Z07020]|uniref:Uncharacterized protein n=1 Tax=Endocarpon pusillum (strain Z07020 / HMAS-L-300199) TaxID=1263415 RepID=U1HJJ7_ENDPU|nr:uncharacterized protein EPUS_01055 [Endocarpon pusillum Z07020]ERF69099.1 hypothetical protein EPUS_01055 [Endocarpon pusillum Z07020]
MSGLDIAAGAASIVALCNLVVCKLVPLLRDSAHTDETVRKFHREICDFKDVLVKVEANFGARTDFRLQRSFDRSKSRAMKRHVDECKRTIEDIERQLPEPRNVNRNFVQQTLTQLHTLLGSSVLSKLREDIPALKATLQLWLQMVQLDGLRGIGEAQERGQEIIEAGITTLNQKMDNLKDALENRDHKLEGSVFRLEEDTVKLSGRECLESAGSVREAYTARYRPTPSSLAARHCSPGNIPAWHVEVMRQTSWEPVRLTEPDAVTISNTNETRSQSRGDSGYDSDQITRLQTIPDRQEGFSKNFLLDLINTSVNEAQRYLQAKDYDRAAEAQEKAIRWGREREQNHGVEFKDEHDMLRTLAKIQLERRMYKHAEEILLRLLGSVEPDSPQAWTFDYDLAYTYLAQGMYESAARYANRANNGRQRCFGVGDNKIIEALTLLSNIYDKMANRTEATVFRLEALKHLIRQEGPSDEKMLMTLQHEPTEKDVQNVIDELEDSKAKDILALKTFQWAVALDLPAIVFFLWSDYEVIRINVDAQNDFGMTPLISSVAFGHEEMVRFLLGKGADVNARSSSDSNNDTALMLAAEKQSTSIVKQLLAKGANVRDYNTHGRNALHRAQGRPLDNVDAARREIVAMVLEKDREGLINAKCTAGKTPLHLASESGNTPIMDFLLTQGADLEARDSGKRTPLILAVDSGWPRAVKLLLDWGAEQEVEDLMGRTPGSIARRGVGGSREIKAFLKEAKKSPNVRGRSSVKATSPPLSQHHNSSLVSLGSDSPLRSSAAILSPTANLPPAFPTQRSNENGGFLLSNLGLPLAAPSVTSASSSPREKPRAWSIYSKINKVGKELH